MPSGVYKHKRGEEHYSFGTHRSDAVKMSISEKLSNEKSYKWKGDNAVYGSKHHWVSNHKGKAKQCSICGKIGKRIHWANIDHKYKRKLDDYISLCSKCHGHYDKINKLRKKRCSLKT